MALEKDEVVFVVHPISYEQKRSYRKQGLKIVDARFAPKGAKVEDPNAKSAKDGGGKDKK